MPKRDGVCRLGLVRSLRLAVSVALLGWAGSLAAQTKPENPFYARVNTFGVFGAYSADSSHFVLGYARNRKLLNIGVVYGRNLKLGSIVSWQYNVELLPVALESDPVVHSVVRQQTPTAEVFVSDFRQPSACVGSSLAYSDTLAAIPVDNAGSFNFTFDLGAGLEFFRSNSRSIRADYRYHHISNHGTANTNPGIDNGVFQVTYAFGH